MPLRHWASRFAGRISPARVSASSSAYATTTKSSSGSSDSLVGRGSSNTESTILLLMAESPFVELEVGSRTVKVTNPDKVFFRTRGETKLDLVQYYLAVGDGIVRVLYERPTQLKRHPDGAEGEAIYQKRVPEKRPDWIEVARVTFPSGRHADELCVTEVAQVAWAANLATSYFHPAPSRRRATEHPDELRVDVDPQPGTDFGDAKRVAAVVREVLSEIGYTGWPKTSGNRGVHVA